MKDKFKLRSRIENFLAKLKEHRRLALQFEKSDLSFFGFRCHRCYKILPVVNSA